MTEEALFPDIRIVLVESTHAGNIGAAARAMKNMGITRLYLVQPRDFPDEKAVWRAAGAADVVEAACVVDSLDDAITGCQLVIGTSARDRRIPWPMLDPGECGIKINEALGGKGDIAILFGRESRGLRNEELQKCHYHVNIPTAKAYSSLNLAMAVQVITWEILRASLEGRPRPQAWDVDYARAEAVEHFFEHLERTLIQIDFHDPENPRQLMTRLRRLFNRVRMDEMEVNILRGFLTAINKLGR